MNASIPDRHSAAVPDRSDSHRSFLQKSAGDEWAAMERKRYAGRPLQPTLPNGDPPSLTLWGEDD